MVKTTLKILLLTLIYTVVFVIANGVLPFSQAFKELSASGGDPLSLPLMFISSAWTCFTIFFIVKNAGLSGKKLFLNVLLVLFFVQYFMTQIETLLFGSAFEVLTRADVALIMLAGLFPLLAVVPLGVKFFQNKGALPEALPLNFKRIAGKLLLLGFIYLCVYMFFGYFVAWQFSELRLFYSGTTEKLSFFGQMMNNIRINPIIFPFQIARGILFGLAILPLLKMVSKKKTTFLAAVCLVYLCTAIVLVIPNVLFPDMVRYGHLIEMSTSMLLFGIIAGNLMWEK